jgi:hypothetical protein
MARDVADLRAEMDAAWEEGFEELARVCAAKLPPEAQAEVWGQIGRWTEMATERLFPPSSTSRRRQFQTFMVAVFMWGRAVERAGAPTANVSADAPSR